MYERIFADNAKKFKNYRKTWYGKLIDRYYLSPDTDEFFNLDYRDVLNKNETVSFSKEAFAKSPKIIWRQTASQLRAVIADEKVWFRNTIQCAYIKPEYEPKIEIKYLLGIINSRYLAFLYNKLVKESGRVFPQVKITHVKKLPLFVAPAIAQAKISDLVSRILEAKQVNQDVDTSAWEDEIDQLVYELYGLTEEEIAIVEGKE